MIDLNLFSDFFRDAAMVGLTNFQNKLLKIAATPFRYKSRIISGSTGLRP